MWQKYFPGLLSGDRRRKERKKRGGGGPWVKCLKVNDTTCTCTADLLLFFPLWWSMVEILPSLSAQPLQVLAVMLRFHRRDNQFTCIVPQKRQSALIHCSTEETINSHSVFHRRDNQLTFSVPQKRQSTHIQCSTEETINSHLVFHRRDNQLTFSVPQKRQSTHIRFLKDFLQFIGLPSSQSSTWK